MASAITKKRKYVSPDPKNACSKRRKQRAEGLSTPPKKKCTWAQDSRGCGIFAKLIDSGLVSDHETVYYLRKKDKSVMKEGQITREGVLCRCCGNLFLLSKFEAHAGSGLHRPSANMFLGDGRSIMQCQQAAEGGEARSSETEPPEARKPTVRWRLYIFKDGEPLNEPLYIHRLSCYLFGRERRVADVPTDHPSCSKQHAVIQYRLVEKVELDGTNTNEVRPYLMDLGSTNGTFLNGERLESERYYELFEKDTVKFGNSSREYVLLHEHSVG